MAGRGAMIPSMKRQVLHISEAGLAMDVGAILQRVQTGAEVMIEHDAPPRPCAA